MTKSFLGTGIEKIEIISQLFVIAFLNLKGKPFKYHALSGKPFGYHRPGNVPSKK